MMRKPAFEMLVGHDGKTYAHLLSAQGEKLLTSNGFRHKVDAIEAISQMMRYGVQMQRFVRRELPTGQFTFQLHSPSGRIVGWGKSYPSREGRDNAIVAVRRALLRGRVLDLN